MGTFREPQIIQLLQEAVARATAFADAVTSTVNYNDSNQIAKKKIRNDHFGEEAVRMVFEARNAKVEGPSGL